MISPHVPATEMFILQEYLNGFDEGMWKRRKAQRNFATDPMFGTMVLYSGVC